MTDIYISLLIYLVAWVHVFTEYDHESGRVLPIFILATFWPVAVIMILFKDAMSKE